MTKRPYDPALKAQIADALKSGKEVAEDQARIRAEREELRRKSILMAAKPAGNA